MAKKVAENRDAVLARLIRNEKEFLRGVVWENSRLEGLAILRRLPALKDADVKTWARLFADWNLAVWDAENGGDWKIEKETRLRLDAHIGRVFAKLGKDRARPKKSRKSA